MTSSTKGKRISAFVPGPPKAQPRNKATMRGDRAGTYDPGTAKGWKDNIKAVLLPLLPSEPMADAIDLELIFAMPRPKAHYRANGDLKERFVWERHTKTPDLDNLAKAVMDAMNDLGVWRDDSQVVKLQASKAYAGDRPGVFVRCAERES